MAASNKRQAAVRDCGGNRWETLAWARQGRVTYAPNDPALAERLAEVPGLGQVSRCLRCSNSSSERRTAAGQ